MLLARSLLKALSANDRSYVRYMIGFDQALRSFEGTLRQSSELWSHVQREMERCKLPSTSAQIILRRSCDKWLMLENGFNPDQMRRDAGV